MSYNFGRFLALVTLRYWRCHIRTDTSQRDCDVYGVGYNRHLGAYLR